MIYYWCLNSKCRQLSARFIIHLLMGFKIIKFLSAWQSLSFNTLNLFSHNVIVEKIIISYFEVFSMKHKSFKNFWAFRMHQVLEWVWKHDWIDMQERDVKSLRKTKGQMLKWYAESVTNPRHEQSNEPIRSGL